MQRPYEILYVTRARLPPCKLPPPPLPPPVSFLEEEASPEPTTMCAGTAEPPAFNRLRRPQHPGSDGEVYFSSLVTGWLREEAQRHKTGPPKCRLTWRNIALYDFVLPFSGPLSISTFTIPFQFG